MKNILVLFKEKNLEVMVSKRLVDKYNVLLGSEKADLMNPTTLPKVDIVLLGQRYYEDWQLKTIVDIYKKRDTHLGVFTEGLGVNVDIDGYDLATVVDGKLDINAITQYIESVVLVDKTEDDGFLIIDDEIDLDASFENTEPVEKPNRVGFNPNYMCSYTQMPTPDKEEEEAKFDFDIIDDIKLNDDPAPKKEITLDESEDVELTLESPMNEEDEFFADMEEVSDEAVADLVTKAQENTPQKPQIHDLSETANKEEEIVKTLKIEENSPIQSDFKELDDYISDDEIDDILGGSTKHNIEKAPTNPLKEPDDMDELFKDEKSDDVAEELFKEEKTVPQEDSLFDNKKEIVEEDLFGSELSEPVIEKVEAPKITPDSISITTSEATKKYPKITTFINCHGMLSQQAINYALQYNTATRYIELTDLGYIGNDVKHKKAIAGINRNVVVEDNVKTKEQLIKAITHGLALKDPVVVYVDNTSKELVDLLCAFSTDVFVEVVQETPLNRIPSDEFARHKYLLSYHLPNISNNNYKQSHKIQNNRADEIKAKEECKYYFNNTESKYLKMK